MCDKTPHTSAHRARESVKAMGTTIRVYFCSDCHAYHVTKNRKGPDRESYGRVKTRKRNGRP